MGASSETRCGFGACLDVQESLEYAGMRHTVGSCSFRESREKSGSTVRLAGKA